MAANLPTEEQVEHKIMTKRRFSQEVEDLARSGELTYMECVVIVCDQQQIDPSRCKHLLAPSILDKITSEAQRLHFIPKTSSLPF